MLKSLEIFFELPSLALQANLESEFQRCLASNSFCWDLLCFLVIIGYAIAFLREACPQILSVCGSSSLSVIFLSLIGVGLLVSSRSYHMIRQFIFVGM